MQSTGAQLVMKAAAEDRSYAGPFAYESQIPHKTFMGEVPCVPLPSIVDALGHSGGRDGASLKQQDIAALRKVIGMDVASCSAQCSPQFMDCVSAAPGQTLGEKLENSGAQACVRQSLSCYQSCIAQAAAPV